ncbi:MAG: histone deacetylase [Verrucomicrobia bacterium]|nr:histone deacetylase [Verrucomicrobiota bacterium]
MIYDESFLLHDTGSGHPESPARLIAIHERLEQTGLLERLHHIDPANYPGADVTTVHSPLYVQRVKRRCELNCGYIDKKDVVISRSSYKVALAAAHGVCSAVDAVFKGEIANAFCAVRPPGHHANRTKAMGFCLFNNAAVGAARAINTHGVSRVLIVDWDVHHGNGTEEIFYFDPTVFYLSIHQHPFYPLTGARRRMGERKGKGFNRNIPIPKDGDDDIVLESFAQTLEKVAARFNPEFVIISAGFDAHAKDPIGRLRLSTSAYHKLTQFVANVAAAHCKGRIVSVLEGGYNPKYLALSCEQHILALLEAGDETDKEKKQNRMAGD